MNDRERAIEALKMLEALDGLKKLNKDQLNQVLGRLCGSCPTQVLEAIGRLDPSPMR